MIVTQLDIENFRGIEKCSLIPHRRMNLFMGNNGSGKTSLLRSVSILLSWLVARIISGNGKGTQIDTDDIRNGSAGCRLELLLDECPQGWSLYRCAQGYPYNEKKKTNLTHMMRLVKGLQTQMQTRLPLVVYYPVTRAVLDIPLRIKGKHKFDTLAAYDGAFDNGKTNFRRFFEWFRQREDLENEMFREAAMAGRQFVGDNQINAVKEALEFFFPQFTDLHIKRNPLAMVLQKDGEEIKINQLSDGEKCFVALVADLSRRLAIANPVSARPLEGEGIVIIDEVDLHLHPLWQMTVIDKLLGLFPNCQFFISSHSPYVASHIQEGKIFVMENTDGHVTTDESELVYGANPETVYTKIMGMDYTRPLEVEERFREISRLIGENRLAEAKQELSYLKGFMQGDPDVLLLEGYIARKELIGK